MLAEQLDESQLFLVELLLADLVARPGLGRELLQESVAGGGTAALVSGGGPLDLDVLGGCLVVRIALSLRLHRGPRATADALDRSASTSVIVAFYDELADHPLEAFQAFVYLGPLGTYE